MPCAANKNFDPLPVRSAVALGVTAVISFWIAFATFRGAAAILVSIPCISALARLRTARQTFYGGLILGMLAYGPPLCFFCTVFGFIAVLLWAIVGIFIGVFLLLLHLVHRQLGRGWATLLTPMIWTGVEYFRSEFWQLKFAWLLPGQAFAFVPGVRLAAVGVYGLGFVIAIISALIVSNRLTCRISGLSMALLLSVFTYVPALPESPIDTPLHVAGVQLEDQSVPEVATALDRLADAHPEAQTLVLSEYEFGDVVPQSVRDVVRAHHRYLVAGGVRWLTSGKFYDTAFVIGPDGRDVMEQYKSVPVQFMDDGLAATSRAVWNSPWGKIGIGICYDLSYATVMDDFVRQGAQGLIVPTNDPRPWGEFERRMLHGRLAPIRSAEYAIPIFGVWSSGVSQLTDQYGRVIAEAEYPGQGEAIFGPFSLKNSGRIPPDRLIALAAMVVTGALTVYLIISWSRSRLLPKR